MDVPVVEHLIANPHFQERHQRVIDAPPAVVWDALEGLRTSDLRLSVGLTRLAGGHLPFRPAPGEQELEDTAALDAFAPRRIVTRDQREIVLADIARYSLSSVQRPDLPAWDAATFSGFEEPGWAKVAMNFQVDVVDGGTVLSTQTRVRATSPAARLRFAAHWAMVRAGSGLVRHDLLRGIERRALTARTVRA